MLTYTVANLPSRWVAAAQFAGASHFRIVFPVAAPTAAAGTATAGHLIFVLGLKSHGCDAEV
jgi:ABC-type glycerol-3-phosphate transport system permease component